MSAAVDYAADELSGEDGGFDLQLAPLKWWRENWHDKNVQKLFIENFIRIRSKHSEMEVIPFRLNDLQIDFLFKMTGKDVLLKFRQGGASTLILALKLCKAVLFSGRNIRFVPHDPDAEDEFWSRLDTMYQHLPSKFKPTTRYYSKELIQFQDVAKGVLDSRLSALNPRPGQEDKLRSQTLTDVHLTEIPFWKGEQEKVFTALMSAADKGEITIESTAEGKEKFYSYYQMGKKKTGGWTSHFYEWWWLREHRIKGCRFAKWNNDFLLLQPDESILDIVKTGDLTTEEKAQNFRKVLEIFVRKEEQEICEKILAHLKKLKYVDKHAEWHSWEVAEYLAWRRLKIAELGGADKKRGLKLFRIEHPENDIDCFDSSTRTVVSPAFLKVTCHQIEIPTAENIKDFDYETFAKQIAQDEWLVTADSSLGTADGDPAAIEVLGIQTGRQALSLELHISPDLLAYKLVEISDLFGGALIGVERNNTGIATLKKLTELVEAERIYKELTVAQRRAVEDGRKSYEEAMLEAEFGIATTTANKALYALFLEEALRKGDIGLSNEEWCEQAQTVIWLNSQKTQWGAMPGHHDDRFIALAIANYIRRTKYAEFMGFIGIMPESGLAR